jgi:hypothetical protein
MQEYPRVITQAKKYSDTTKAAPVCGLARMLVLDEEVEAGRDQDRGHYKPLPPSISERTFVTPMQAAGERPGRRRPCRSRISTVAPLMAREVEYDNRESQFENDVESNQISEGVVVTLLQRGKEISRSGGS